MKAKGRERAALEERRGVEARKGAFVDVKRKREAETVVKMETITASGARKNRKSSDVQGIFK